MSETYDETAGRHRADGGGLRWPKFAAMASGGGLAAVVAAALTIAVVATALVVELGGLHHSSQGGAGANSVVAGPGGSPDAAGPAASPTGAGPTASPATTAPVAPATASSSTSVDCTLGQLRISVSTAGQAEGGMGHSSSALLFRNVGSAPCEMRGYPSVVALDKHGRALTTARTSLRGYMGGVDASRPPTVRLDPGESASALVEALNAQPNGDGCRPFPQLRVTPPGASGSRTVSWGRASGCANLEVHPIVPGASGRM